MLTTADIIRKAWQTGTVVPSFNISYLPMVEPIIKALRDTDSFGLITVARPEWMKFQARSLEAVAAEYQKFNSMRHTRLHLDHVPVIDEDHLQVDYLDIIRRALAAGYESVMVDGSRIKFEENIRCTKAVVTLAHAAHTPVESELGAVMGHETGPMPPYEELFASGKGFTDPEEARRFVAETGTDWLSVAIGNIHGAIADGTRDQKKLQARLNIEHLDKINRIARVPLVLHGGSGIQRECLQEAFRHGIAKINIGTAVRQPYEQGAKISVAQGQAAAYQAMLTVVHDELKMAGSAKVFKAEA